MLTCIRWIIWIASKVIILESAGVRMNNYVTCIILSENWQFAYLIHIMLKNLSTGSLLLDDSKHLWLEMKLYMYLISVDICKASQKPIFYWPRAWEEFQKGLQLKSSSQPISNQWSSYFLILAWCNNIHLVSTWF